MDMDMYDNSFKPLLRKAPLNRVSGLTGVILLASMAELSASIVGGASCATRPLLLLVCAAAVGGAALSDAGDDMHARYDVSLP